jgi:hypothetical protein
VFTQIENNLNNRTRKSLNYLTPVEAMVNYLQSGNMGCIMPPVRPARSRNPSPPAQPSSRGAATSANGPSYFRVTSQQDQPNIHTEDIARKKKHAELLRAPKLMRNLKQSERIILEKMKSIIDNNFNFHERVRILKGEDYRSEHYRLYFDTMPEVNSSFLLDSFSEFIVDVEFWTEVENAFIMLDKDQKNAILEAFPNRNSQARKKLDSVAR